MKTFLSIVPPPVRRGGAVRTLSVGASEKPCPKCSRSKDVASFGLDKHTRDGLTTDCKSCRNAYARARNTDDPDIRYAKHLKKKLGPEAYPEYGRLLRLQNGVCAVCREAKITKGQRRMHLDHDHVTGKIRGVLCRDCNCAIGSALDDPMRLRALADYVEKHR